MLAGCELENPRGPAPKKSSSSSSGKLGGGACAGCDCDGPPPTADHADEDEENDEVAGAGRVGCVRENELEEAAGLDLYLEAYQQGGTRSALLGMLLELCQQ